MNSIWNKIELSTQKKNKLRKLFFQKKPIILICKKIGITQRVFYRIVNENSWLKKRERYWLYLIKKAYRRKKSIQQICKEKNINSVEILNRIKRKYKIKTQRFNIHNKRIDMDTKQKMIQDYNNLISSNQICKKYGFKTRKTVLDVLKEYNIPRREPKIITYYNEDYFKKINSHDKAYILGILLTDGYIIRDYEGFGIQLTENDGYLLSNMAKRLGKSTTIIHINYDNKRKKAKLNNWKKFFNSRDMERMCCYNGKMAYDLKKLGVVKNKTHIVRCPKIPKKYLSSLCRGMWDGDGSIGIAKTGNIWCRITSVSEFFIKDLQEIVPFPTSSKNYFKNGIRYDLRICQGNKQSIAFLKWIYKNKEDLYLERKYEKVQDKIN